MKNLLTMVLLVMASLQVSFAQTGKDPVSWKYEVKQTSDDEVSVDFTVTISGKWHLYTQFFEDGGPKRMEFKFADSKTYQLIGKVEEKPKPTEAMDKIFEMKVQYFEKTGGFSQKMKLLTDQPSVANLEVSYQVCSDESCLAFTRKIEIQLPAAKKVK